MDIAAFYGNCQAQSLRDILADHPPFARLFSIEALPPVHGLQEGDHQRVVETASRAKLFVQQPISGPQFAPADTETLIRVTSPAAISLCFPVLWFDAYGPDVQYLRLDPARDRAPSDYHSTIMIEAYLLGRTCEQAVRTYLDTSAVSSESAEQIMRDAVQRLRERETWTAVNMFVADFVEAESAGRRLFHTFNHPSSTMLYQIADEILCRLDLPRLNTETRLRYQDVLSGPRMPEMVAVHQALGLKFDRYTDFRGFHGTFDVLEFAQASFRHYSEIRLETLMSLADLQRSFIK